MGNIYAVGNLSEIIFCVFKMNKDLYLFDFDGTLTKVDTLFDFLKFSFAKSYHLHYMKFIPLFILAKLKIQNKSDVKQKFISCFLKGMSRSEIKDLSRDYFESRKNHILRMKGMDYIHKIGDSQDKYIVSASLDIWIEPFALYLNMGLICTRAEFNSEGIFTGKFSTPNCNYEEKKKRIKETVDLNLYNNILVFGDTKGDEAMFSLATEKFFRHFQ